MSVAHFQAPDAPGFKLDPRVVASFARFAGGYWRGERGRGAWLLTLALAGCLLLSTAATVGLNHWNRWFFDSLEARDVDQITRAVFVFGLIIASMAAVGVGIVLTRETSPGALACLDRGAPGRALARQPALLSLERHRQGATQPRIPHLRRHALGDRAAGGPGYRPAAGSRERSSIHLHPLVGRRLDHAQRGRRSYDSCLHGDPGAGLWLPRLGPDAVGRRAAGRLRRAQERGRGLFPLRDDAHSRQCRECRADEWRALRAGGAWAAFTRPWWRAGWRSSGSTGI